MRVAMIDPSLFTLPYDQALATGLVAQGHAVTLHGRRPGPDDSAVPEAGLADGAMLAPDFYRLAGSRLVSRLPNRARLAVKGVDHVWSMARLLRRLRRARPDVIHFQWLPLPPADAWMLRAFRRVAPLVLTVHDTNPFNGDPSARLQASGMARCYGAFGRLILHTRQGAERVARQGVTPGRIAVVPHGPLPVAGAGGPDGPAALARPPVFVLFGKIKPYKGADLLIEAFARLSAAQRAGAQVQVVGRPYMDLAPLHRAVERLGLAGAVRIEPRFVADCDIPAVLGPGTIAVFPYREIEASGVLQLALTLGRPVIASAIGGMAEALTDGVQGALVPPADPTALARAMARMIADPAHRGACSRNAWATARAAPGWDTIAAETATIYRAAAG